MDVLIRALIGVCVGAVLGAFFFGGLWWTTQRLATSSRPGLLLSASFAGRLLLTAVALVTLASIHGALLLSALAGMLASRAAWTPGAISSPIRT